MASEEDKEWIASALFAMGRSANECWQDQVLAMLESNLPILRQEAARAAGELEIRDAVPLLIELLDDPDQNTRLASMWSLSQIGGEGVRDILEQLYEEADDDTEVDLLEASLDNLAFTEDSILMPFFDFPEDDEFDVGDADDVIDLLENDEGLTG
jgi:HEAT repeat protein